MIYLPANSHPHPSTIWALRRATSLIQQKLLLLRHTTNYYYYIQTVSTTTTTITTDAVTVCSLVDKKTWVKFTRENLLRSSREREKSNKLHAEMDGYLRSAAVELYTVYNMANHALSTRVQETTDVKNKLQERLLRVCSSSCSISSGSGTTKTTTAATNTSVIICILYIVSK